MVNRKAEKSTFDGYSGSVHVGQFRLKRSIIKVNSIFVEAIIGVTLLEPWFYGDTSDVSRDRVDKMSKRRHVYADMSIETFLIDMLCESSLAPASN